MKAQILSVIPVSGLFEEVRFRASGNCMWVKFECNENSWVGVFGQGPLNSDSSSVTFFGDNSYVFVVARGQGYAIDIEKRVSLQITEDDCLVSALSIPESNAVLACNFTELILYNLTEKSWDSGRIAQDGIKFTSVTTTKVYGFLWQFDGWFKFEFDVASRLITKKLFSREWDAVRM